jgi:hypothetical protein
MVATPVATVMATPAVAQSAADIFDQMLDRQRQGLSGIDNLLIEQETMGVVTTLYLVKEMVDGEPVLRPRMTIVGGMNVPIQGSEGPDAWSGSARVHRQWADRFRVDGTEDVNGRAVYRLAIDDFAGIDMGTPPGQDTPMTPRSAVFYVDKSDLVMVRMEMELATTTDDGEARVVTMASTMDDYRDIDGYLHPFRTSISWQGLTAMVPDGMDSSELEQQLEEMETRLADMPTAQRGMVERMLKPQIERLRDMLDGAPMEIIVTKLEANVAPPGGP